MKKLLIVSLLLILSEVSAAQQSTARRTFIEEFTSSSSDASAASDPVINQFEGEAPGKFCIVKWYLPIGTNGGTNPFFADYPLSKTRSQIYYGNDTVSRIFLNGGNRFDPNGLSLDELRAQVAPYYSKTSPFAIDITQQVIGDSVIATVTVRQLDTTIDLTKLSLGVIITERYNQFTDINHYPYHTNIVRTVLPSLDPKLGLFRDALPFAFVMQGHTVQTFRYAAQLGIDWDMYGLASTAVIQDNTTKEVLQCNWTVPEISFSRPTPSTYLFLNGATPCQFDLLNTTDSDFTIYPQLVHNAPAEWNLELSGMVIPNFVLKAHTRAQGTFVSEENIPFRGSGDFILLLRTDPGIVVANISGTLIGNDSRDIIIRNWASAVYQVDPDIVAWKQYGLDAAIINEDAIGDLFDNNLLRFRTVYVERSNYGNLSELGNIRDYMAHGGRMIFNSNSVLNYFSNSVVDTTINKYAVVFGNIFRTAPAGQGSSWSKGNVVPGNVFTDTLASPFAVSSRPIEELTPLDTFSKPLFMEQGGHIVGTAIETGTGKIAYLTFPLSDIQNATQTSFVTAKILSWFALPNSKVNSSAAEEPAAAIYPNPISAAAIIRYSASAEKAIFTLHDELGRVMAPPVQNVSEGQLRIDCSSLPSGTYYYSLQTGEKLLRGKMVVSH